MPSRFITVFILALTPVLSADTNSGQEGFISNQRQFTSLGRRAGEGYFSQDNTKMIFQSERTPDNPFFQIYIMDLQTGKSHRVSNGIGKTTCAWFFPNADRVIFASSHEDPDAKKKQHQEYAERKSGKRRHKMWDYDPWYDIYSAGADGSNPVNLTKVKGYDAECAISPDGKTIVFASNRHAYADKALSEKEKQKLEKQPEYFLDLYMMDADGTNIRRLHDAPGHDGGPFFSTDGKKICWRRFNEDETQAEIWVANADGSDQHPITNMKMMSWAPFFHPSGDYIVFTTNRHGFHNFELYIVRTDGRGQPVRATVTDGFDGLPVITPDGHHIVWTCNRTPDRQGQLFVGDWDDTAARKALDLPPWSGKGRGGKWLDPRGEPVPKKHAANPAEAPGKAPWLGTIPDFTKHGQGVVLRGARKNSPADKAGILPGDDLVSVSGKQITNINEYADILGSLKPGQTVPIAVLRNGKRIEMTITVAARPAS